MSDLFRRNVFCLLGLPFDAVRMDQAIDRVHDAMTRRSPCVLSTPNLNFVIGGLSDPAFRDSVINSHLSIVDGMPLVWIARLLGIPLSERVAGSDLFERLRADCTRQVSVYFFGGEDGVAETAAKRLNADKQGIECAGYESPGFGAVGEIGNAKSIARINASGADFLAVSLGARKGQAWIERHREDIAVPVICHLGAVVNFVAGKVNRAPAWMRRAGLEWLWRIKEEPGLWRRYANDGAALLSLLATRIVPLAWHLRAHRPARSEIERAAAKSFVSRHRTRVRLSGAWTASNLDAVRDLFAQALATGKDVAVDMRGVSSVDCAFVGLAMLLSGEMRRRGLDCVFAGTNKSVRRVFELSCADFLIERDTGRSPARLPASREPAWALTSKGARRAAANDDLGFAPTVGVI